MTAGADVLFFMMIEENETPITPTKSASELTLLDSAFTCSV